MVTLNVIVYATAGFLGLGFLLQTLRRLSMIQLQSETIDPLPMPTPQ